MVCSQTEPDDDRLRSPPSRRWSRHRVNGSFRGPTVIRAAAAAGTFSTIAVISSPSSSVLTEWLSGWGAFSGLRW